MLALHDATIVLTEKNRRVPILEEVEFTVPRGQWVVVVGRNGSGKSTLLQALAGILPLEKGTLSADGRAFDGRSIDTSVLRLVTSHPEHHIVGSTPREDLAFGLQVRRLSPSEIRQRVDTALQAFDLAAVADRPVHQLSGGQLQRVALAGAWVTRPQWILLDEPTSMLDPGHQHALLHLLDRLRREGIGIVHTTHTLEEVWWADRVYLVDRGRVIPLGHPSQIAQEWKPLSDAGFPKPWKWRFVDTLRAAGADVHYGSKWVDLAAHVDRLAPQLPQSGPTRTGDAGVTSPPVPGPGQDSRRPCASVDRLVIGENRLVVGTCRLKTGLTVLLGASGAGKSTFLWVLLGLLRPLRGTYEIFGGQPYGNRKDMGKLRQGAAMALQFPEQQLFSPTVYDDIAYTLRRRGMTPEEIEKRVRETAAELGIEHLLPRSPFSLSFGEQRRAALAVVLALRPKLLALDEPFAGMDPAGRTELAGRLRRWAAEHETAVIIATHHIDELLGIADEWILLHRGRLIAQGVPPLRVSDPQYATEDPEGAARLRAAAAWLSLKRNQSGIRVLSGTNQADAKGGMDNDER